MIEKWVIGMFISFFGFMIGAVIILYAIFDTWVRVKKIEDKLK